MKIFINVAAYQEPNLKLTLNSLYTQAKYPENLVFSVVDQSQDKFKLDLNDFDFKDQIRYIHLDPLYARGPCFARSLGQTQYNNEDYYFQTDAHCVFDSDWDITYIRQYEDAKRFVDKPVLTQYPFGFEFEDAERTQIKKFHPKLTPVISLHSTERTFETNHYVNPLAKERKGKLIPGFLLSAGQVFTAGRAVYDVPYDPFLFFGGEEQTLALRYWTNGYDIVHFENSPMYHLYYQGPEDRTLIWNDQQHEERRQVAWTKRDALAVDRMKQVCIGEDLGVYGIGKERTLEEYKEFSGIDYINKTWEEKSVTGDSIWNPFY
jgi:hypothetical protein